MSFSVDDYYDKTCNLALDCTITCFNSKSSDITFNVDRLTEDDSTCKRLALFISDVRFPQNVMNADWYNGSTLVKRLSISDAQIEIIASNAFRSFGKVADLQLINLPLDRIENGAFNELSYLEFLYFRKLKLRTFEPFLLQPCRNLKYFTLEDSDDRFQAITVDGLLGTGNLTSLTEIYLYDNYIHDTITQNTFLGLKAVSALFLPRNKIISIGSNAFKPIASTLFHLNLEGNNLKVLSSVDFFHLLLDSNVNYKSVQLANNPWHCDCKLISLKDIMLMNGQVFSDEPTCYTPNSLHGKSLKTSTFCSELTNSTNSNQTLPYQKVNLKCNPFGSIVTVLREYSARIRTYNFKGKLTIIVENYTRHSVLVVFKSINDRMVKVASCFKLDETNALKVKMVLENEIEYYKTYMICVIRTISNSVTPFNCVSYHTHNKNNEKADLTWLSERLKFSIAATFLIANLTALVFGILTAYVAMKKCTPLKGKLEDNEADQVGVLKNNKM